MNRGEETKRILKEFRNEHKALTTEDVMLLWAILIKYGFSILDQLNVKLSKLEDEEEEKYRECREEVNKIKDM